MSGRVTVEIHGIAAGGEGVGRLEDGRAVFVHRTAPGDRVRARITQEKPRWARAELITVERPAASRRAAPCPYYTWSGGCTLEHLDYEAQLRAKSRIVADALERIAGVGRALPAPEVVPSPREFHYRNRVSFTLLRLGNGRVVAGFHEVARPDRVVDMGGECLLPEEPIAAAWAALRSHWGRDASRLPAGARLRLVLRATAAGEVTLLVEQGTTAGRPDELLERVPGLASIWVRRRPTDPAVLLAGAPWVTERWGDEEVRLAGATFVQVNRWLAPALEAHVLALAGDVSGRTVVDAYCGLGVYARRLARAGARAQGIELDAAAVEEARRLAGSAPPLGTPLPDPAAGREPPDVSMADESSEIGETRSAGASADGARSPRVGDPGRASFTAGRVEALLEHRLPADLVIVNPPRAGLDAAVTDLLRERPVPRVIYVSCDPATLARDVRRLGDGYELRSLRCFDLFPQTAHVETVAELICATR